MDWLSKSKKRDKDDPSSRQRSRSGRDHLQDVQSYGIHKPTAQHAHSLKRRWNHSDSESDSSDLHFEKPNPTKKLQASSGQSMASKTSSRQAMTSQATSRQAITSKAYSSQARSSQASSGRRPTDTFEDDVDEDDFVEIDLFSSNGEEEMTQGTDFSQNTQHISTTETRSLSSVTQKAPTNRISSSQKLSKGFAEDTRNTQLNSQVSPIYNNSTIFKRFQHCHEPKKHTGRALSHGTQSQMFTEMNEEHDLPLLSWPKRKGPSLASSQQQRSPSADQASCGHTVSQVVSKVISGIGNESSSDEETFAVKIQKRKMHENGENASRMNKSTFSLFDNQNQNCPTVSGASSQSSLKNKLPGHTSKLDKQFSDSSDFVIVESDSDVSSSDERNFSRPKNHTSGSTFVTLPGKRSHTFQTDSNWKPNCDITTMRKGKGKFPHENTLKTFPTKSKNQLQGTNSARNLTKFASSTLSGKRNSKTSGHQLCDDEDRIFCCSEESSEESSDAREHDYKTGDGSQTSKYHKKESMVQTSGSTSQGLLSTDNKNRLYKVGFDSSTNTSNEETQEYESQKKIEPAKAAICTASDSMFCISLKVKDKLRIVLTENKSRSSNHQQDKDGNVGSDDGDPECDVDSSNSIESDVIVKVLDKRNDDLTQVMDLHEDDDDDDDGDDDLTQQPQQSMYGDPPELTLAASLLLAKFARCVLTSNDSRLSRAPTLTQQVLEPASRPRSVSTVACDSDSDHSNATEFFPDDDRRVSRKMRGTSCHSRGRSLGKRIDSQAGGSTEINCSESCLSFKPPETEQLREGNGLINNHQTVVNIPCGTIQNISRNYLDSSQNKGKENSKNLIDSTVSNLTSEETIPYSFKEPFVEEEKPSGLQPSIFEGVKIKQEVFETGLDIAPRLPCYTQEEDVIFVYDSEDEHTLIDLSQSAAATDHFSENDSFDDLFDHSDMELYDDSFSDTDMTVANLNADPFEKIAKEEENPFEKLGLTDSEDDEICAVEMQKNNRKRKLFNLETDSEDETSAPSVEASPKSNLKDNVVDISSELEQNDTTDDEPPGVRTAECENSFSRNAYLIATQVDPSWADSDSMDAFMAETQIISQSSSLNKKSRLSSGNNLFRNSTEVSSTQSSDHSHILATAVKTAGIIEETKPCFGQLSHEDIATTSAQRIEQVSAALISAPNQGPTVSSDTTDSDDDADSRTRVKRKRKTASVRSFAKASAFADGQSPLPSKVCTQKNIFHMATQIDSCGTALKSLKTSTPVSFTGRTKSKLKGADNHTAFPRKSHQYDVETQPMSPIPNRKHPDSPRELDDAVEKDLDVDGNALDALEETGLSYLDSSKHQERKEGNASNMYKSLRCKSQNKSGEPSGSGPDGKVQDGAFGAATQIDPSVLEVESSDSAESQNDEVIPMDAFGAATQIDPSVLEVESSDSEGSQNEVIPMDAFGAATQIDPSVLEVESSDSEESQNDEVIPMDVGQSDDDYYDLMTQLDELLDEKYDIVEDIQKSDGPESVKDKFQTKTILQKITSKQAERKYIIDADRLKKMSEIIQKSNEKKESESIHHVLQIRKSENTSWMSKQKGPHFHQKKTAKSIKTVKTKPKPDSSFSLTQKIEEAKQRKKDRTFKSVVDPTLPTAKMKTPVVHTSNSDVVLPDEDEIMAKGLPILQFNKLVNKHRSDKSGTKETEITTAKSVVSEKEQNLVKDSDHSRPSKHKSTSSKHKSSSSRPSSSSSKHSSHHSKHSSSGSSKHYSSSVKTSKHSSDSSKHHSSGSSKHLSSSSKYSDSSSKPSSSSNSRKQSSSSKPLSTSTPSNDGKAIIPSLPVDNVPCKPCPKPHVSSGQDDQSMNTSLKRKNVHDLSIFPLPVFRPGSIELGSSKVIVTQSAAGAKPREDCAMEVEEVKRAPALSSVAVSSEGRDKVASCLGAVSNYPNPIRLSTPSPVFLDQQLQKTSNNDPRKLLQKEKRETITTRKETSSGKSRDHRIRLCEASAIAAAPSGQRPSSPVRQVPSAGHIRPIQLPVNLMMKPSASIQTVVPVPRFDHRPVDHISPFSAILKGDKGILSPPQRLPVDKSFTEPSKLQDSTYYLQRVLKWNPLWLEEQAKPEFAGHPPPILLEDEPPYPLLESYNCLEDYQTIMTPLLLLETWDMIVKDSKRKKFVNHMEFSSVNICNKQDKEGLSRYVWQGVLTQGQYNQGQYPMEGDLITMNIWGSNFQSQKTPDIIPFPLKCYCDHQFGYVERMTVRRCTNAENLLRTYPLLRPCVHGYRGDLYSLNVTVLCRYRKFKPEKSRLMSLESLCSLATQKRQYQAMIYLPRSPLLRAILHPRNDRTFHINTVVQDRSILKSYNQSQAEAISGVCQAVKEPAHIPRICLLQGPPGTGKTHTVTGIISKIIQDFKGKCCVCVCTPSNGAADELMRRLIALKNCGRNRSIKLVRFGKTKSIHSEVLPFSYDELVKQERRKAEELKRSSSSHLPESVRREERQIRERIENIEKELAEFKVSANKVKSDRKNNELRKYKKELTYLNKTRNIPQQFVSLTPAEETGVRQRVLHDAHVICGTLSSLGSARIMNILRNGADCASRKNHFTCVIIDEATQATELDCLIPLQYGISKLVMVGDPEQLPPTVLSKRAKEAKFGLSLFERFYTYFKSQDRTSVMMLKTQYRMDPAVLEFPNLYVYDGLLNTDRSVLEKTKNFPLHPYLVFNIESGQEVTASEGSVSNEVEAGCVAELCHIIIKRSKINAKDIGVICPYQSQRSLVVNSMAHLNVRDVEVGTVDGFQGREKHVIIMSCVRARSSDGNIGFLSDRRRMNVALTRAKYAMFVLGHLDSLKTGPDWRALINDAQRRNVVVRVQSANQFTAMASLCFKKKTKGVPELSSTSVKQN